MTSSLLAGLLIGSYGGLSIGYMLGRLAENARWFARLKYMAGRFDMASFPGYAKAVGELLSMTGRVLEHPKGGEPRADTTP